MVDDPKKKKLDSLFVSQQEHEVEYLKRKYPHITKDEVRDRIERFGPTREEVEKALRRLEIRRRIST